MQVGVSGHAPLVLGDGLDRRGLVLIRELSGNRLEQVAEHLANGDLVEPLPQTRLDSPLAYWLMVAPRSVQRPEVKAFCDWLKRQAEATRHAIGDEADPETLVNAD